ncbi:RDD family protein [Elizabethkingia miricola]|nr:hypothetical protein C7V10_16955 [Elizabethkingia miricola]QHQ87893.1 RDD family protein [Elizabethkingia miricola]
MLKIIRLEDKIIDFFRRGLAYIFDIYFITTSQIIIFSLYRYISSDLFRLSLLYIIQNFRFLFLINALLYFFLCEYIFSKTLGKKIFKLKIVYNKNRLLSAIIRTLIRLFPFDLFFILIPKYKPLHDILAKTEVIKRG